MSSVFKFIKFICVLFFVASSRCFADEMNRVIEPSLWMIIPFILLLIAIASMPFINKQFWERYYPHVSIILGAIVLIYYSFVLDNPVRMLHSGIEYFSFICLIGSLFIVSGGIHITLEGYSTPMRNVMLLLIGAIISNLVGTTGASMILIRPYLRNNKYRLHPYHVVFFIFIVSNIGGALTPIGDPPLFLGYLRGIPFFWVVMNVWNIWLLTIGMIIGLFYLIDRYYYRKVPQHVREEVIATGEKAKVSGMHNWIFILLIIIAAFIPHPLLLREGLMILAAVLSYFTTKKEIHVSNHFTFHPLKEVGFLFLGIFITMVPALDWLELHASQIGIHSVGQFYWSCGMLSSVLDNAPTYLNFLHASVGMFVPHIQTSVHNHIHLSELQTAYLLTYQSAYIKAISVSAVFFGAITYIGNGPNFMVKSIAEHYGAKVPGFFNYIWKYSLPILLPIFFIVWLLFFSNGM